MYSANITKSQKKVTPFGGIEFISSFVKVHKINKLIDDHLGSRYDNARYSYSQLFLDQFFTHLAGGSRVEDVCKIKHDGTKALSGASPDTILNAMSELSVENNQYSESSGVTHTFNCNNRLNDLLAKAALHTKQITEHGEYILDYDNTINENSKKDALPTYKKTRGYQPGVAFIGKLPLFVGNRNGNSPATYRQHETLENCFQIMDQNSITIKKFRADVGSYTKQVINLLDSRSIDFFIRAKNSDETAFYAHHVEKWEAVRLSNMDMEVGETSFRPFKDSKSYRLILVRFPNPNGIMNIFSGDSYCYSGIITNDETMSPVDIVKFYNQRGEIEKNFDVLKNDFNWKYLPFSSFSSNTVYMILTALYAILYEWIKQELSQKIDWVNEKMRLKGFRFYFISVAAQWVKRGRQLFLKLFTHRDYPQIQMMV